MSTLNWLEENLHRSYPFTREAPDGEYLYSLVDAAFVLGQDFDYDLDQEQEELRLVSVVVSGGSTWTFRHYRAGAVVPESPDLVFAIPQNPAPQSTWSCTTAGTLSHGYITLGDPAKIVTDLTLAAPLEDRVVRAHGVATTQTIRVFNTIRPASYRPYFTSDPAKSPAQNYLDAVAASPYGGVSTAYAVATAGTTITGDLEFVPGYNTVVSQDTGGNRVTFELSVGAGQGRDCTVPPAGTGYAGTLRGLNGQPGSRGDLWLTTGKDFELIPDQDNFRITIRLKALSALQGCGQPTAQSEPAGIQGPP